MRYPLVTFSGLALLGLAAMTHLVLSERWAQRLPAGWSWKAEFVGRSSYPDTKTGQFPPQDALNQYVREFRVLDETRRPGRVRVHDRYTVIQMDNGKVIWEYLYEAEVDPHSGKHLEAEHANDYALFPRYVQKTTYSIRSNYLKGVPLRFEREERIDGLATYLFSYHGPAEYTESYAGTPDYPGVKVEPGQEIRAGDDRLDLRFWVEPVTGEIVKLEEAAPAGDWVYEVSTGKQLGPVFRWAGSTAGDDVIHRVSTIKTQRAWVLWTTRYGPGLLALAGVVSVAAGLFRFGWPAAGRPAETEPLTMHRG